MKINGMWNVARYEKLFGMKEFVGRVILEFMEYVLLKYQWIWIEYSFGLLYFRPTII